VNVTRAATIEIPRITLHLSVNVGVALPDLQDAIDAGPTRDPRSRVWLPGNVVIHGHRSPSAFYRLAELIPGDDIFVVTEYSLRLNYRVWISKVVHVTSSLVKQDESVPSPDDRVTLVTCSNRDGSPSGEWANPAWRLTVAAISVETPL
jgi:LPXTG-site transpeptidase (sortase) family protein